VTTGQALRVRDPPAAAHGTRLVLLVGAGVRAPAFSGPPRTCGRPVRRWWRPRRWPPCSSPRSCYCLGPGHWTTSCSSAPSSSCWPWCWSGPKPRRTTRHRAAGSAHHWRAGRPGDVAGPGRAVDGAPEKVLRQSVPGGTALALVRSDDAVLSRSGGDELAVRIPGWRRNVAVHRAEDLLEAVR